MRRGGMGMGSDVLERPYTVGVGGVPPPPGPPLDPPPFLPFQCLRLTAKILLRRLRCQEDLSLKIFGLPSAGTQGGGSQPPPPPPFRPPPSDPPPPSNTSLGMGVEQAPPPPKAENCTKAAHITPQKTKDETRKEGIGPHGAVDQAGAGERGPSRTAAGRLRREAARHER